MGTSTWYFSLPFWSFEKHTTEEALFFKKNLQYRLIFCKRKEASLIKYPCHGKYALVNVSHVVVNHLPCVQLSFRLMKNKYHPMRPSF